MFSFPRACRSFSFPIRKFGIDKDHRRILGHHLDPGETSVLTYSCAAMDVPLEKVSNMLLATNRGEFDPDSSRNLRRKLKTVADAEPELQVGRKPAGEDKVARPPTDSELLEKAWAAAESDEEKSEYYRQAGDSSTWVMAETEGRSSQDPQDLNCRVNSPMEEPRPAGSS